MSEKIELVVFTDDWYGLPFSAKHLLKNFLPETPVNWVETIGLRSPKFTWYDIKRSFSKITGWMRPKVTPTDPLPENLDIRDPLQIPYNNISCIRAFNMKQLIASVGKPRAGYKRVFITTWPFLGDIVGKLGESASVYYRVDDFTQFPGVNTALVSQFEEDLIQKVDIVAATAEKLMPKNKNRRFVKFLPHGVDYNHFASKERSTQSVNLLEQYSGLRIGFFGLLNSWLDFEFIKGIAEKNPDASVVIIGPSQLPESDLPQAPNIHYTGSIPYADLPKYAAWFDVALVPFAINELTLAVNPLKLLEYFALGLPVVSTPLPEVIKYGDTVSVVADSEEATVAIRKILLSDGAAEREKRQNIAFERSWQGKAIELRGWIDDIIAEKQSCR
jgi:glycosyltransferase involved in cell wall biosynthesis